MILRKTVDWQTGEKTPTISKILDVCFWKQMVILQMYIFTEDLYI